MSATMTVEMPSMNGSSAAAAQAVKEQATGLRERALGLLEFWRMKAKAALAWAGAKISTVWSAVKAFAVKHAALGSLGLAAAMSVKGVYHSTARAVTTAAKWVASTALTVVDKAVYYAAKAFTTVVGGLINLFSPKAGASVATTAGTVAGTVHRWVDTAKQYVTGSKDLADAVLTADRTTAVVTTGSALTAAAIGVNMLTGGTLAGMALELPVVGATVAAIVAGAPISLLAVPALIAAGILLTVFTAAKGQYRLTATDEPQIITGEVVPTPDAPAGPAAAAEQVVEEAVEAAVLTYDPQIDVVGVEAYTEQTEAIMAEAGAFKQLADEVAEARSHKANAKGKRNR